MKHQSRTTFAKVTREQKRGGGLLSCVTLGMVMPSHPAALTYSRVVLMRNKKRYIERDRLRTQTERKGRDGRLSCVTSVLDVSSPMTNISKAPDRTRVKKRTEGTTRQTRESGIGTLTCVYSVMTSCPAPLMTLGYYQPSDSGPQKWEHVRTKATERRNSRLSGTDGTEPSPASVSPGPWRHAPPR